MKQNRNQSNINEPTLITWCSIINRLTQKFRQYQNATLVEQIKGSLHVARCTYLVLDTPGTFTNTQQFITTGVYLATLLLWLNIIFSYIQYVYWDVEFTVTSQLAIFAVIMLHTAQSQKTSYLTVVRILNGMLTMQFVTALYFIIAQLGVWEVGALTPKCILVVLIIGTILDLPFHKLFVYEKLQLPLFPTPLIGTIAVLGLYGQTILFIQWLTPSVLAMLMLNTCLICLGIKQYLSCSILTGPTILNNYYDMWLELLKGNKRQQGILPRAILIAIAISCLNPLLVLTTYCTIRYESKLWPLPGGVQRHKQGKQGHQGDRLLDVVLRRLHIMIAFVCLILSYIMWTSVNGVFVSMLPIAGGCTLDHTLGSCILLVLWIDLWFFARLTKLFFNGVYTMLIGTTIYLLALEYDLLGDYDPLVPLTLLLLGAMLRVPWHTILTNSQLGMFKNPLMATTAMLGVFGQAILVMPFLGNAPYLIGLLWVSTTWVCVNIKPFLDIPIMEGSTVYHHYYRLWCNVVQGTTTPVGVGIRLGLVVLALSSCNPMLAHAMSPDIDTNMICPELPPIQVGVDTAAGPGSPVSCTSSVRSYRPSGYVSSYMSLPDGTSSGPASPVAEGTAQSRQVGRFAYDVANSARQQTARMLNNPAEELGRQGTNYVVGLGIGTAVSTISAEVVTHGPGVLNAAHETLRVPVNLAPEEPFSGDYLSVDHSQSAEPEVVATQSRIEGSRISVDTSVSTVPKKWWHRFCCKK